MKICENPIYSRHFISHYQLLVGGLEHEFYDFPYIGIVTPTDELIFFRGIGIPPTSISFIVDFICENIYGTMTGLAGKW